MPAPTARPATDTVPPDTGPPDTGPPDTPPRKPTLRAFGPPMGRRPWVDIGRTALGAGLGILIAALMVHALPGARTTGIYLVSSLASTAVLIFVLPNSPLAQPWPAVVGNTVSALVSVAVLRLVPPPFADGLAVAVSIAAMMALRALHPPAAGIALLAALEYEAGRQLGFSFALMPVAALTLVLVLLGIGWNRLTGRAYPLRQLHTVRTAQGPARRAPPLPRAELERLLSEFNQSANLGPADLARLIAAAETRATQALFSGTTVARIMTPAPVTIGPDAPLSEILNKFDQTGTKSLPVTDSEGRYLGLVDLAAVVRELARELAAARRRIVALRPAVPEAEAAALMSSDIVPVDAATPVGALLEQLSERAARVVPVTSGGHLVGVITRTDLIALLLAHHGPAALAPAPPDPI